MRTSRVVVAAAIVFLVACSAGDHARQSLDVGTGGSTTASGSSGSTGGDVAGGAGGSESGGASSTATGGSTEMGGTVATGGFVPTGGSVATGGSIGTGGSAATGGFAGTGGFVATGGSVATGGAPDPGAGETGRMVGMTAAHNEVRSQVVTSTPIPNLTWSITIADVAQAYANQLASSGCNLVHSGNPSYGENLAWFAGQAATAADVVSAWAQEGTCYTYGLFETTDSCTCVNSGCGHYTQVVWRTTTEVGCGVAVCPGQTYQEIWVCNYSPPGNYVGYAPY